MATQAELLNAELLQYQQALAQLTSGDRVTEMIVGSGATQRRYKYQEINEDFLRSEIARIKNDILALEGTEPTFRTSSVMYTSHRKQ